MTSSNVFVIVLRAAVITALVFSWARALNPAARAFYKRSHVPVSRRRKFAEALILTGFCLAIFGVRPLLCFGLCMVGVAIGMGFKKLDVAKYDKETRRMPAVPMDPRQEWKVAFVLDVAFLILFLCGAIRNQIWPSVDKDQRILYYLGWGFVTFFSVGAIWLLLARPRENALKP